MIEFTVPGRPVPQARPRVVRGHAYTPAKSAQYQRIVAATAAHIMKGKELFLGSVACEIELYFAIPKSYTKGKRLAAEYNVMKPVTRSSGDADNHAKAIMDALTGVCWGDDSQVTRLSVIKRFTKDAHTEKALVRIFEDREDAT